MAVVVRAADEAKFIQLAAEENLEAYRVAEVTDTARLVMKMNDQTVVDLARRFIDTSGVRQEANVEIATLEGANPFGCDKPLTKEAILATMAEPNVCCQKGLGEMFDASIGSTTVLMPYAGSGVCSEAAGSGRQDDDLQRADLRFQSANHGILDLCRSDGQRAGIHGQNGGLRRRLGTNPFLVPGIF